MSVSPPPLLHKRPTRTYGRPKQTVEDPASVQVHHGSRFVSNDKSLSRITSDTPSETFSTLGLLKSSSADAADDGNTTDDDEDSKDASSGYAWSWKAEMKKIDASEDEEEGSSSKDLAMSGGLPDEGSKPSHSGPLSSKQGDPEISHSIASPSPETEPSHSPKHFSGSLPTLTPSAFGPSQKTLASPSPSPSVLRKRVSKRTKVIDSDAESDLELAKSSNPSSPVKHPINTPQTRSSTTPPTSDSEHEMTRRAKPSSKGKASAVSNPLVLQPAADIDVPKARRRRSQTSKVKAPTKKELEETILDRQRMNAEKQVSIPRAQRSHKLTFSNLLSTVAGKSSYYKSVPLKGEDSMDPISDFSSSPSHALHAVVQDNSDRTVTKPSFNSVPELPEAADSDDEQLVDMDQLLKETQAKSLKEKKLQIIQQQEQRRITVDNDDDDLEVVDNPNTSIKVAIKEEAAARKSGRSSLNTSRRVMQKYAGIPSSRRTNPSQARTQQEWNKELKEKIDASNARRIQEKSEEWVRRGGRPLESELQVSERHGLDYYAQKALENSEKVKESEEREVVRDEDDEEDEEWSPSLRGSASPAPDDEHDERDAGDRFDENEPEDEAGLEDQDITMVNEDTMDDDPPNQEDLPRRRSRRGIVNSDTEEDENDENTNTRHPSLGTILVQDSMILDEDSDRSIPAPHITHRHSDSSCEGGATEDEGDKENNDRLMYDRSEDKENTAVVRHKPGGGSPSLGRHGSLFNLEEGLSSRLSVSSDGYATDEDKETSRSPLKTLSVAGIEPLRPSSVPFATRLQRASSAASGPQPAPEASLNLAPGVVHEGDMNGFSQFSDDGEGFQPNKLEPGFSSFLDLESQKPSSSSRPALGSLQEPIKSSNIFAKLRKNTTLGLTQDVGLQPALEVDASLARKADKVFEMEQDVRLEEMNESTSKKPELYINDQGFLTQTRPDGNAEVYRPPPTPSQPFSQLTTQVNPTQNTTRQPFRELSMSQADFAEETPTQTHRLHRLRKRDGSRSPSRSMARPTIFNRHATSPSLPSPTRVLTKHRNPDPKIPKTKRRLEKSEFIEGEAQESDEDEMFGFRKAEEDEEDGDHLDRTLETLVDDQEMDQSQIAEDKVMEKYQEHRQADDVRDEELAQQVVDGQRRYGKRNRKGAGLDDSSDDEEEDEKNRRIRRKMKEPELRGDIKSLAGQDETRAFAQQYEAGIKDDGDPELAYLLGDGNNDITMTGPNYGQDDDDNDKNENDENDEHIIDRSEVVRQLREAARNGEDDGPALDPNDLSFVDADIDDDDNDIPRVRQVTNANLRARGSRNQRTTADSFEEFGFSQNKKSALMINEHGRQQAEAFVKQETRLRRLGGRSGIGGISVLGNRTHSNSRADLKKRNNPVVPSKPGPQPLKAAPSMLKSLDRREQFQ
ncbi:hypothetical protein FB446DRAFT_720643 [Lentinula raphanica]|nr:hypothetical protein FB446DRAFT_720643 [Lentinula raphanica]